MATRYKLATQDRDETFTNKTIASPTITWVVTVTDNNASALSIDATWKTWILKVNSTDGSEGIEMSWTLKVWGNLISNNVVTKSIPLPVRLIWNYTSAQTIFNNNPTTMSLFLVSIDNTILNKITFETAWIVTTAWTVGIAIYSENGQTRICNWTVSVSAINTAYSITISWVAIPRWNYWIWTYWVWTSAFHTWNYVWYSQLNSVSWAPSLSWTYTITSWTPPTTITPASIVAWVNMLMVRLDT